MRGAPDRPGEESHYRDRSVEESLDLFERMRAGEFPDGARTLRAKIDMGAPNVWLRDPVLYRIRHASHHHTGDAWCIYPMYDFAHGSERLHRGHHPQHLHARVRGAPAAVRMDPGGARPAARASAPARVRPPQRHLHHHEQAQAAAAGAGRAGERLGRSRACRPSPACGAAVIRPRPSAGSATASAWPSARTWCELGLLEHCVRDDLNRRAPRAMAVLRPLRVVIENYPRARSRRWRRSTTPRTRRQGTRRVPFSRVVYIEQDDFREVPPPSTTG